MTPLLFLPPPSTVPLPSSYAARAGDKMATVLASVSDSDSPSPSPPTYSPSSVVPSYSVEPGPSERTLVATARSRRRRSRDGVFVRKNDLITLALRGQEELAFSASYDRNDKISGDIGLSCTQDVQCIRIVLEGRLNLASPECGSVDGPFFSVSYDIWGKSDDDADGRGSCPSMFPFEIVMPETFKERGVRRALPPSYEIEYPFATDIRAKCSYLLRVVVQRKGSKLAIWKLPKKLTVPFVYQPRTRAPQPILSSPFPFLSTVKSLPEEWFQITSTMSPKVYSDMEPIDCHLFIPAVQTFALNDTIPFYLQLIAPSKSLQALLLPIIPAHARLKCSTSIATEITAPPTVRVYLLRQVIMAVKGQLATRQFSIGEGQLRSLPPGASLPSPLRSQPLDDGLSTLDYEGEVHSESDVTVGQFGMARLQIRDFITMYLAPPNQFTSPLHVHQHSHPIRLVTDPFPDSVDSEARAL